MITFSSDETILVVMHGWSGTFLEAVGRVLDMMNVPVLWRHGIFYMPKRNALMLRQILNEPDPGPELEALQKGCVARLMAASCSPSSFTPPSTTHAAFAESTLFKEAAHFGVPALPGARHRRASQLLAEAYTYLQPVKPRLRDAYARLRRATPALPEQEARTLLYKSLNSTVGHPWLHVLERLRDMNESGGDLDSVASAVLLAHALRGCKMKAGGNFLYGRDCRFVLVNYHESFYPLTRYAPAAVLMADLPITAFPAFEQEVRSLQTQGVRIGSVIDHHPVTTAAANALQRLHMDGMIEHLDSRGKNIDTGTTNDLSLCAADIVYEDHIRNRHWDCPGARHLRRLAHAEDLVTDRTAESRMLTDLIKSGICKTELAELLLGALPQDRMLEAIRDRGWDLTVATRRIYLESLHESVLQNTFALHVRTGKASSGGNAVKILVLLPPATRPGKPGPGVHILCDLAARRMPDADILFICYGSSLLVARRLNQDDTRINLGRLLSALGGPGDGGHGGAAVCRPDHSTRYPSTILPSVHEGTFASYVRYLSERLEHEGLTVDKIVNCSATAPRQLRHGSRHIAAVILAALAAGLLLVLFHPSFRAGAVRESNRHTFPELNDAPGEGFGMSRMQTGPEP